MIILPAIDIKDGNCVRLVKGDYGTAHKVADSYMDTARMFEQCGAQWIHMVDLDGAKDAAQTNKDIFLDVAKNTKLKVEVGGGIRTPEAAEMYLNGGVERVIIGSAAVKNPELVKTLVKEYGEHIAVGIDAKNGMVATEGWLETSDVRFTELDHLYRYFQRRYIAGCERRAARRDKQGLQREYHRKRGSEEHRRYTQVPGVAIIWSYLRKVDIQRDTRP